VEVEVLFIVDNTRRFRWSRPGYCRVCHRTTQSTVLQNKHATWRWKGGNLRDPTLLACGWRCRNRVSAISLKISEKQNIDL